MGQTQHAEVEFAELKLKDVFKLFVKISRKNIGNFPAIFGDFYSGVKIPDF